MEKNDILTKEAESNKIDISNSVGQNNLPKNADLILNSSANTFIADKAIGGNGTGDKGTA